MGYSERVDAGPAGKGLGPAGLGKLGGGFQRITHHLLGLRIDCVTHRFTAEKFPRMHCIPRMCLIVWVIIIVGAMTLPGQNFQGHPHWGNVAWIPFQNASISTKFFFDMVANWLLYFPLGYLMIRSVPGRPRRGLMCVILCSTLLAFAGEFYQVFCHNRHPSMTDVVNNVFGGTVGALLAAVAGERGNWFELKI